MNARLIKTLRQLNSLTQNELADRLDCSRTLIAKIETKQAPVSRSFERKLTQAFGISHVDKVREAIRTFEGEGADDV